VEEVVRQWGAIDILINNAGIELHGSVVEITPDEWDRQLDVNLKGAFLFSRCAISYMRQRDGAIVNISSVHAMVSWPGTVAYDVSKCGLIGLTRSVALDHGRDGIRVNALCPGYIHTPITDRWLDTVPDREAAMRRVLSLHPLGRIGTPRDVAEACLFLVSDAASFINGGWRSRVNASISIRTSSRVDTLNGSRHANMKELRFTAADGERRVAFAFDTKRKAILLVAGDKSGVGERRFYRGLIRKADDRFDAHLARLKKERR
jgi:short-subunit dehydrogenase